MRFTKGKCGYKTPVFEEIVSMSVKIGKVIYKVQRISPIDMDDMRKSNKAKVYGVPAYFCYLFDGKKGSLHFYPIPDKAYTAKCRHLVSTYY